MILGLMPAGATLLDNLLIGQAEICVLAIDLLRAKMVIIKRPIAGTPDVAE